MKKEIYDVIIFGAGPAGTTTAMTLKKLNPDFTILIIDKESFPRYKLGESILPGSISVLEKIDCLGAIEKAGFLVKIGTYYFWGKYKNIGIERPFFKRKDSNGEKRVAEVFGYHVDRSKYDSILLNRAKEEGISTKIGFSSQEVSWNKNRIETVIIDDISLEAKYYVDAGGINSTFISHAKKGLTSVGDYFGNICFHGYLKGARHLNTTRLEPNHVSTTVTAHSNFTWSWYIPIDEDVVSIGVVLNSRHNQTYIDYDNKEHFIIDTISENLEIKEAIFGSEFIDYTGKGNVMVTKNWNGYAKNVFGDNWFLVGDAAFFSDPILSSGVTMSHKIGNVLGILLGEILQSKSDSWTKLIKLSYQQFLIDSYKQVKDIIRFWYEGMDGGFEVNDLFTKGNETLKSFGITHLNNNQYSFGFVVNGFLNSIDDEGGYNTLIHGFSSQLDFEDIIKIVTGIDVALDTSDIVDSTVYIFKEKYKILQSVKIVDGKVVLGYKIKIYNQYNSTFYITESIRFFLSLTDGHITLSQIFSKILLSKEMKQIFLKDIKRLELLGLIEKK